MAEDIRTTHGLVSKLNAIQGTLIKRFGAIVDSAAINRKDRNSSAALQYQMQVDTAALIRQTEELHALIHSLQELWLFGQLKTISQDPVDTNDQDAKEIQQLLSQLTERWAGEDENRNKDAMEVGE